ncbi:MAG: c-type cytochrome biogenesis protein CcsB [Mycobacteriales bacterium]
MPVDQSMAVLSDQLLVAAILAYTVAMFLYAVEYAFGRRGYVSVAARETRVLVGAGGPPDEVSTAASAPVDPADESPSDGQARPRIVLAGRIAVVLTVLGVAAHAGSLVARGLSVHRVPWGNMYEFDVAVCLIAVSAYLVLLVRQPLRYLGAFVMLPVVLLLGLAGTVLYTAPGPLVPALDSYWLKIHVSAAILATGIFLVGFTTSVLYLLRERYERRLSAGRPVRFPTTLGVRLPAADLLERSTFRIIAFGFPIWTFAVIAGAIWAEAAWGRYWAWDPKETWAFIAWVIYAAYLHARSTAGVRGRAAVGLAVLGWGAMMFNLFGVNMLISGLHSYAGLN